MEEPTRRGPGRPPGAKNKPKAAAPADAPLPGFLEDRPTPRRTAHPTAAAVKVIGLAETPPDHYQVVPVGRRTFRFLKGDPALAQMRDEPAPVVPDNPPRPSPLAPRPSLGWAWGLAAALVLLAVGAVWWQGRPVAAGPPQFSPPVAVAPAPTGVAQAWVEVPPDQARTVSGAPPAMAQAAPVTGPVDLPVSTGALAGPAILAAAQQAGLPTGGLTLPDAAPDSGGGRPAAPPAPSPTHVSVEVREQPVHRPQRLPPTGVPIMPPALPVVRAIPAPTPTPTPRQSVETHDQAVHHTKP